METYFAIWTRAIMWVGLFALSILVPVVCAAKMFPFVNGAFAKFRKLPKWEQVFAMFIVVVLTIYAGTKPHSPKITFENGLRNDGSLVTNDTVHIEWVKTGTPYIPDGAALYIDYRPYTATNEEWGLLGQTTVGAYEFNTTLADATNYDYNVWYFYVPPEPVHTNGVWTYKTMPAKTQTPDTLKAVPLRAVTKGDGRAIASPAAKRQSFHWNAKRRIADYLYEISFDESYPDVAEMFYRDHDVPAGLCSARRNGDVYERNYDWFYGHAATFVVHVAPGFARYGSVGVASVGEEITDEIARGFDVPDAYFALPGMTLDGINTAGVFANINVVATNGAPWETRGGRDINALGAVRWILDCASDAASAASAIAERAYIPDALKRRGFSAHFLIGDATETWIVEDGVARNYTAKTKVLTNFRVFDMETADDPFGTGYERYDLLASGGDIKSAWFRSAYRRPFQRPSEFASPGVGTHSQTQTLLNWAEANIPQGAPESLRRGGGSWQSVHTSIYNVRQKTLGVMVQENPALYNFTLEMEDNQ